MEESLDKDLAKELLTFLSYFEDGFVDGISDEFFNQLVDLAADSTKEFYIDEGKTLMEQEMTEECKNMISLLYFEESNPSVQEELVNSWIQNDLNGMRNS